MLLQQGAFVLSASVLKIIACAAMALSHFGGVFRHSLPPVAVDIFYFTGRIAFPVFAYLITEGWKYTRSKRRYMLRLFGFALLSQIPYSLALEGSFRQPLEFNVLFTLFLGTCMLQIEDMALEAKGGRRRLLFVAALLPAVPGFLLDMDFGWKGILCVGLMGLVREKKNKLAVLTASMMLVYLPGVSAYYSIAFLCTLPALILLYFYNGSRGRVKCKYLFYLFYPLHLLVFYCIYSGLC